jgi:hypothetical protein
MIVFNACLMDKQILKYQHIWTCSVEVPRNLSLDTSLMNAQSLNYMHQLTTDGVFCQTADVEGKGGLDGKTC